jgi:hypothetical protein
LSIFTGDKRMTRLRNFFIGRHLSNTDDVFDVARAIMFYRLTLAFAVLFILPLTADFTMGLYKAFIKHGIDFVMIFFLLFYMRYSSSFDRVINLFFTYTFFSYLAAFMMLNPMNTDPIGFLWATFFLVLSALLQRGWARIAYCLFLGWVPIIYVLLNIGMDGALTVPWLVERIPGDPPVALMFVPMLLSVVAIWSHSATVQTARETITLQKKVIEERNKEITDSIHYARRIQQSLQPTEKYIARCLDKKEKVKA